MNTKTTLFLPADLTTPMRSLEVPHTGNGFNLHAMYREIGCDLVETVHCYDPEFQTCLLWCDEEARLKGDPQPNVRASILAGQPIFGNVILSCYHETWDRSWDASNPLPFVPCDLDALAVSLWENPQFQAQFMDELYS